MVEYTRSYFVYRSRSGQIAQPGRYKTIIRQEMLYMKNTIRQFVILLLAMTLTLSLSGCSNLFGLEDDEETGGGGSGSAKTPVEDIEISDDMSEEDYLEVMENAPVYEEEAEDAKLHYRQASDIEYIGSWTADSGSAIYNYGNVDLTIRPGGFWKGNIAEEDLSGKWKLEKGKLILSSDYFNAELGFTDKGKLIMQENRVDIVDGSDTIITTVLTKK